MNLIDIIILISLAIALIGGFIKGFILSLAGLVGWILGIVLSFRFAGLIQDYLTQASGYDSHYMYLLAFILCFVAVVLAVHFIGKSIEKIIKIAQLGFFNRLAGAVFGLLKTLLLWSALIYLINLVDPQSQIISPEKKENSYFYQPLSILLPKALPFLRERLHQFNITEEEEESISV